MNIIKGIEGAFPGKHSSYDPRQDSGDDESNDQNQQEQQSPAPTENVTLSETAKKLLTQPENVEEGEEDIYKIPEEIELGHKPWWRYAADRARPAPPSAAKRTFHEAQASKKWIEMVDAEEKTG